MIIFHEGLPGSGKSYEAVINQIIPALMKGRHVYAYIEGLNHQKFSDVTGLSLSVVDALLHQLQKEQVKDIHDHVQNDSLVIIDELQDFFPSSRTPLDEGITEFVTQHRHRGIDIICMGQDNRDCHSLWKRRVDNLITFVKRDAVGMAGSYTWTTFKQTKGKFVEIRKGKGTYDSKYFGLYASHSDGVSSIDAYQDDRTNVFKSSTFRVWLPLFFIGFCYAIYYIWGFFHSTPIEIKQQPKQVQLQTPSITPIQTQQPKQQQIQPPQLDPKFKAQEYANFVEKYLEEYRPRLSGVLLSKHRGKLIAQIDFYQDDRIVESFSVKQIEDFGYTVLKKSFGLLISKKGKSYPVTMWPLDIQVNVPNRVAPSLKDEHVIAQR